MHEGVDLACSEPKEFKAGIYGKVFRSGGGDFNTITVKLIDGTIIQYLHSSAVYVREGDIVGPDTVLGITGKTGASAVHLHIQARDLKGPIHPDKALALGLKKPVTTIYPPDLKWVDFDIEAASVKTPNVKVVDGTVRITFDDNAPKGFEGVWATDRNGFVLRVEKGGKFYVVNPSSGGSISAGKWSEDKNTLQGSTESVFSTDTWSTTYGEVHDVEMSIVGAKLVGKWRSNYLTESGKEVGKYSEGKFTKCPEFLRKQSIDFKDYWWMDKHK